MGRYMGKNGKPTNDQKLAAVNAKTGQPVDNPLRNLWVTETALTTALHSSYFAESVATFAIVMGFALMLTGGGFLVLTLRVLRVFGKEEDGDQACGRDRRGRALELIAREQDPVRQRSPRSCGGFGVPWFSERPQVVGPDGTPALAGEDRSTISRERIAMPIFMDSPSGERPPKRRRSIGLWMAIAGAGKDVMAKGLILLLLGVPVYVVIMWWRGRETAQDVIPEASAQAQVKAARVKAAHGREEALA